MTMGDLAVTESRLACRSPARCGIIGGMTEYRASRSGGGGNSYR